MKKKIEVIFKMHSYVVYNHWQVFWKNWSPIFKLGHFITEQPM